jgi:phenylalanyl-tRNA synthetase beta chain
MGRIRASVADLFGLKDPVFAAEIELGLLLGKMPRPFTTAALTKFPAVVRDLSFLVGRETSFQDVRQALARIEAPYLERFEVIDRYAGDKLPPDKVGLSLRFTYRDVQGTLTAEDVDKSEQKIILHLKTAFGMQLREGGTA